MSFRNWYHGYPSFIIIIITLLTLIAVHAPQESIDSLPSEFQKATILTLRQFSSLLFMLDTENTAAEALGTTRPRSSSTPRYVCSTSIVLALILSLNSPLYP